MCCKPLKGGRLLYSQPINVLSSFEGISLSGLSLVGSHVICNECSAYSQYK